MVATMAHKELFGGRKEPLVYVNKKQEQQCSVEIPTVAGNKVVVADVLQPCSSMLSVFDAYSICWCCVQDVLLQELSKQHYSRNSNGYRGTDGPCRRRKPKKMNQDKENVDPNEASVRVKDTNNGAEEGSDDGSDKEDEAVAAEEDEQQLIINNDSILSLPIDDPFLRTFDLSSVFQSQLADTSSSDIANGFLNLKDMVELKNQQDREAEKISVSEEEE